MDRWFYACLLFFPSGRENPLSVAYITNCARRRQEEQKGDLVNDGDSLRTITGLTWVSIQEVFSLRVENSVKLQMIAGSINEFLLTIQSLRSLAELTIFSSYCHTLSSRRRRSISKP